MSFTSSFEILKFPIRGFYSTRGSPPVMVDFQIKVVDSLSPCFRGDFPESVTDDRYVTSECEDPWKHLKNGKPWAPHHPFTCEPRPHSPQTETYTAVNTTRVRCEDVTFGCSRLQNVIKVTPFYSECESLLDTHPAHLLSRPSPFRLHLLRERLQP